MRWLKALRPLKDVVRDPDNPIRSSRTKITAVATAGAAFLAGILALSGRDLPLPEGVVEKLLTGGIALALWFLRDRSPPKAGVQG